MHFVSSRLLLWTKSSANETGVKGPANLIIPYVAPGHRGWTRRRMARLRWMPGRGKIIRATRVYLRRGGWSLWFLYTSGSFLFLFCVGDGFIGAHVAGSDVLEGFFFFLFSLRGDVYDRGHPGCGDLPWLTRSSDAKGLGWVRSGSFSDLHQVQLNFLIMFVQLRQSCFESIIIFSLTIQVGNG